MSLKVSIITVVYNAPSTIATAIESVISQDYEHIEYIVIDGGSTDGTIAQIKEYESEIDIFVSEADKGMYDALNKGINLASGEVIGILHADDMFANISVIAQVADLFMKKGTDSIYGDLVYVNQDNTDRVVREWKSGKYDREKFLFGWMPPHPTFFVKKECFLNYGLYDLSFKSAADYELMLRFLYKRGITSCYLPEVLVRMRVGGTSNANLYNRLVANQQDRRAWKKNNLNPRFYTLFLKPLRKLPQYFSSFYLSKSVLRKL